MLAGHPIRSSFRLVVVAAVLISGLALTEFPELLRLKDDTANDFALLVSRQDVSATNSAAKSGPAPATIPVRESIVQTPISNLLALSIPEILARSATDYLHLLCVHRT